uniref:ATP-dependent RNA helicase n=1 Tax=Strigamia maritima TaxID=126957 RepID=T1JIN4_STRMM
MRRRKKGKKAVPCSGSITRTRFLGHVPGDRNIKANGQVTVSNCSIAHSTRLDSTRFELAMHDSAAFVFFIVLIVSCWKCQLAYPDGAPDRVCSNGLVPGHGRKEHGVSPYRVSASSGRYSSNKPIRVRIESLTDETFKGFVVQAQDSYGDAILDGDWRSEDGKPIRKCGAITHRDSDDKQHVTLTWTPKHGSGSVTFVATIAKTKKLYYHNIKADVVGGSYKSHKSHKFDEETRPKPVRERVPVPVRVRDPVREERLRPSASKHEWSSSAPSVFTSWSMQPHRPAAADKFSPSTAHHFFGHREEEPHFAEASPSIRFVAPPSREMKMKKGKTRKQKVVAAKCRKEVGTLISVDDASDSVDMSAWDNLFVPEPVLRALGALKYETPTNIQSLALPSAIRDRMDIVGAAETGSGKTLAFGIPLVHHILRLREEELEKRGLYALVLTPTRELAIQVKNHLKAICRFTDITVLGVMGGISRDKQERLLRKKPEIIVATPGRLWELMHQDNPHLSDVNRVPLLVIDEADRMLEPGHFTELANLLEMVNRDEEVAKRRQTFVFSATLTIVHDVPYRMKTKKKKRALTQTEKLSELMAAIGVKERAKVIDVTLKFGTTELLQEARINCANDEKDFYLYYLVVHHVGRTLVFCNSIDCVRRLNNLFTLLQRSPVCLHASMHQKQRLKNLERFSVVENGLLIATDVAARGLDIPHVDHVIHYQVPRTSETYVHRSGRTARAFNEGLSVMLIDPDETNNYRNMCRTLNRDEMLPIFPVDNVLYGKLRRTVEVARDLDRKEHRWKRLQNENNWFQKAAKDMDLELDQDDLTLNNLGDSREQSVQRKELKGLRSTLNSLLSKNVVPFRTSVRYPFQSGKLPSLDVTAREKAATIMKKEKRLQKEIFKADHRN